MLANMAPNQVYNTFNTFCYSTYDNNYLVRKILGVDQWRPSHQLTMWQKV